MSFPGTGWLVGNPIIGCALMTSAVAVTNPGRAIMITASVAGTVTLTLTNGSTIVVNPAVGDNIYPFAVMTATDGTATVTHYYNLT